MRYLGRGAIEFDISKWCYFERSFSPTDVSQFVIILRINRIPKKMETVIVGIYSLKAWQKQTLKKEENWGWREVIFCLLSHSFCLAYFILFCLRWQTSIFMVCGKGVSGEASFILLNVIFSDSPNPSVRGFPKRIHCQWLFWLGKEIIKIDNEDY